MREYLVEEHRVHPYKTQTWQGALKQFWRLVLAWLRHFMLVFPFICPPSVCHFIMFQYSGSWTHWACFWAELWWLWSSLVQCGQEKTRPSSRTSKRRTPRCLSSGSWPPVTLCCRCAVVSWSSSLESLSLCCVSFSGFHTVFCLLLKQGNGEFSYKIIFRLSEITPYIPYNALHLLSPFLLHCLNF